MGKIRYCLIFLCLALLVGFTSAAAPVANFTATPLSGTPPLQVSFTDLSLNNPSGWAWYFGDENFTGEWTQLTDYPGWSARKGHSSVAMPDGSIVLMGGTDNDDSISAFKNDVWRSIDNGATWTLMNASAGWSARKGHSSVAMPDGSIVLMGGLDNKVGAKNDTWRSMDNGATWTRVNASSGWTPRSEHSSAVMPDGSIILMGGMIGYHSYKNDVWRSTDNGSTWTQLTANAMWSARAGHTSVVMPDGSIILMGGSIPTMMYYANDVWRSMDSGITWTLVSASSAWSARDGHSSVAMPDGSIVLTGGYNYYETVNNDVWWSMDNGTTWTPVNASVGGSAQRQGHSSVAMPDGSIVLMGGWDSYDNYMNDVWQSTDNGSTWTQLTANAGWSIRSGHTSVVMPDGSIVLMGGIGTTGHGEKNDVWRSTDNGTAWTQLTANADWSTRYGHSSVVMPDASIVLMGGWSNGAMNDVWQSTDNGASWTFNHTTPLPGWMSGRYQHSSVILPDGSIVLMGGSSTYDSGISNEVWRSMDNGATWIPMTASAEWSPRQGHSSVVMPDGSIVLMGGTVSHYDAYKNDVWRSTDNGVTWTQLTANAGWSARAGHTSVVMQDGSIILMGGTNYFQGGLRNDVWRSTDNGATWIQLPYALWSARAGHTSVVMPDGSIVLMGGYDSGGYKNDVWRFMPPAGSSAQNPSHTYTAPGRYTVVQHVYNPDGYNSTRKIGYITVKGVDLSPTEFGVIGQSESIDGIIFGWEVENRGNGEFAGNWTDAVYLSTDQILDADDIKLSSFMVNRSLSMGESYSISEKIDYSNPVQDGMYYLLIKVDDQNEVLEANERNNVIFRPLQIESAETFNETAAHQSLLTEDLKIQNLASDTGLVTGDLTGTINLTSVELVTITSGSYKGQGFFKGIFTANLEGFEYSGDLKGVIIPDSAGDKILLKGTISGSEIAGLFDGTLTELTPGSEVYDHFMAEWKLNRVQGDITSSTLQVDSNLSMVDEHTYSSVPLTLIQTSMSGATFGDYEETISAVLTHLHISDPSNPFKGKGFSTLSYNSATGQGQGWTYDTVVGFDFIDMKGVFTSPLEGVVSGTLTTNPLRTLSIFLERLDLGLPILPDLKVAIFGPLQVSPGQTVDYIIQVRNDGVAVANDVVVVDTLPREFEYISSSSGGTYRWENHEAFWIFDTFAPRSLKEVVVKGYIPWGLSGGLQLNHTIYAETTDYERDTYPDKKTAICNLDQYRTYQPSDAIEIVPLSIQENEDIRNTQNYQDILAYALSLGYIDTNTSSQMIMPGGSEVTLSLLLSPDPVERPEMVFITRFIGTDATSTDWFLYKFTNNSISLFDREGGIAFNVNDGTTAYLGNWGEMHSCPRGACRVNCYWNELRLALVGCWNFKTPVGDLFGKSLGSVTTSIDCNKCKNLPPGLDRRDSCARCAISVIGAFPGMRVPGCAASLLFETARCEGVCRNPGTSPEYSNMNCNPGDFRSTCSNTWNIADVLSGNSIAIPKVITEKCTFDCRWELSSTQTCVSSDPNKKCDCLTTAGGSSVCDCDNPNKGGTISTIAPAHDPNIKYGPEGHVLAGQTLDYRIEYENMGEGIAYGVYFVDTLDEDLDASSLTIGPVYSTTNGSQIAPPGTYNPGTRTITWLTGEVGPHEGGYANISMKVRSDAPENTEIINYGIVYFPSVPEETTTNAIVSVVGVNHPPAVPANPTPSDNDNNVLTSTGLNWIGNDPDGDTLRYDVYFGNTPPLPLLERDTFSTMLNPGILAEEGSYSWQVIARDPEGAETPGPVWSFSTRSPQPSVLPLPGFTTPPTDPDSDGLFEDLNANGFADWDDAVVLFWNTDWIQENEPVTAFDFNHNSFIDWDDAVVLFWEV